MTDLQIDILTYLEDYFGCREACLKRIKEKYKNNLIVLDFENAIDDLCKNNIIELVLLENMNKQERGRFEKGETLYKILITDWRKLCNKS